MHQGERIRLARLEQGRTLREVAEQVGTHAPVLLRWERGQQRFDPDTWLDRLADALQIPRQELAALPQAPGRPTGRPRTAAPRPPRPPRRPAYPPDTVRLTAVQAAAAQRVFADGGEDLGARFHPPAGLEITDLADARRMAMAAAESGDDGARRLARRLLDL